MIEKDTFWAVTRQLALRVKQIKSGLVLEFPAKLADDITQHFRDGEQIVHDSAKPCRIQIAVALPLRGGQRLIVTKDTPDIRPDPVWIAALRRAHSLLTRDGKGMPLLEASPASAYDRKLVRLAFLAPDNQRAMLMGGANIAYPSAA